MTSKDKIRKAMQRKTTPWLSAVLEDHDTKKWTDEAFEVIEEILEERSQNPDITYPEPETSDLLSLNSQSQFAMDGVLCLKDDDGSVIIKGRKFHNLLILVFFGLVFSTSIACLLDGLVAYFLHSSPHIGVEIVSIGDLLEHLFISLLFPSILVVPILILVRGLIAPPILFNTKSKILEIGRGSSSRLIPFSRICHIAIELRKRVEYISEYSSSVKVNLQLGLVIVLDNGELVELGTVSGEDSKGKVQKHATQKRAYRIAHLIADATGVPVH